MSCATCDKPVYNFKILTSTPPKTTTSIPKETENADSASVSSEKEETQTIRLLPSVIEDLSIKRGGKAFQETASVGSASQSSSPTPKVHSIDSNIRDVAVLRIDNVPWVRIHLV